MDFRIRGLDPAPFRHLYGATDAQLADAGARRMAVDAPHGYPDRIEIRDAQPGETVLLVNHLYLDTHGPYRGRHAIFVREGAERAFDAVNEVPEALGSRLLSLRAFDRDAMMVDADVVDGRDVRGLIDRLLADPRVAFVHAHHARRGCYACLIERA
jgi:hypothetical protein